MNSQDHRRFMKAEDHRADKARPFTGAEYMASLRDGREVYINGERIADVTAHPAMRNSVRSLARLYDALHDEKTKARLTSPPTPAAAATRINISALPARRRNSSPSRVRSPTGRGCPTAGWAAPPTTRRR